MVRDLTWVAAVRDDTAAYSSGARALSCLRGGRPVVSWAWRWAVGLAALVLLAALAPRAVDAGALALSVACHQAGVLAVVFARASWLAAAVRAYDRQEASRERDASVSCTPVA
jgi:hypothetical protein